MTHFNKEIDEQIRLQAIKDIESLFAPLKFVYHPDMYIIKYRGIKWYFPKGLYSQHDINGMIPGIITSGDIQAQKVIESFVNPIYTEIIKQYQS